MNFKSFEHLALLMTLLLITTPRTPLIAEQLNCFKYEKGSIKFFNCDHNCSADKNARFNSSGQCSVCGHLLKNQPDFFIESGTTKGKTITNHSNNQE